MKPNTRRILLTVLFILSIGNFSRIQGNESVRTVLFVSIFVMGMLFGLLLREVIELFKNKQNT